MFKSLGSFRWMSEIYSNLFPFKTSLFVGIGRNLEDDLVKMIDVQFAHPLFARNLLTILAVGRQIGSRVGRNQTTVIRICDRWIQEGMTDRRGRSHPPQCTTSREDKQIVRMAVTDRSVTSRTIAQHIDSIFVQYYS
ncbi:UNVERIFIED_CONTAM: hypothetical protein NCL1_08304 [Trichonephila clavipes]